MIIEVSGNYSERISATMAAAHISPSNGVWKCKDVVKAAILTSTMIPTKTVALKAVWSLVIDGQGSLEVNQNG